MHQTTKISAAEALKMIDTVIAEAKKINKDVAVAIAGPEGELISFLRMDGASGAASVIATNKAYTSARDRKSTREMGEFMQTKNRPPAFWGDPRITGFGGGLPVIVDSGIIGGIGVSGLSEEEDERIASLAVMSVFG